MLTKEEEILLGKVSNKVNDEFDKDIVLDVVCVLPNGTEEWITLRSNDNPEEKAKEICEKHKLGPNCEKKIVDYIKSVKEQEKKSK